MRRGTDELRVGFVLDYILFSPDSLFIRKDGLADRVDYVDRWLGRLSREGMECIKYAPARYIQDSETIRHRLGHKIKLVPVSTKYLPDSVTRSHFRLEALAFALNLRKEVSNDRIGILHYANYFSTEFAYSPLISWKIPTVVWFSGGNFPRTLTGRWGWFFALHAAFRNARLILIGDYPERRLALSWALREDQRKVRRFQILRVEKDLFAPRKRDEGAKAPDLPNTGLKILCVLSSIPPVHQNPENRDPFTMVRLLGNAVETSNIRDVTLAIIGAGPGLPELQRVIRQSGLEQRVRILNPVPHENLPPYYAWADLVFLPMRLEALNEGYVLAEAFASSRPVVAFKRNPSIPVDQPGGFLLDREPDRGGRELAAVLVRKEILTQKGKQGLTLSALFDEGSATEDLLRVYKDATTPRRTSVAS